MTHNVGTIDRAIRVVVGLALVAAFFYAPGESAWRYLYLIGLVPLVTGLAGSCPAYRVLGLSTCARKT